MSEPQERLMKPALLWEAATSNNRCTTDSYFGRVDLAAPGESWPYWEGTPLKPLLQLRLPAELPYRPQALTDVGVLALYCHPRVYPEDEPNNTCWCLRVYPPGAKLTRLENPGDESHHVPLSPPFLSEDYPAYQDVTEEVPDEFFEEFSPKPGLKLGGWPSLIQSEIYWAPLNEHPAKPEYVFQVDSIPEIGWWWGDRGCAYVGRGTAPGFKKEWFLSWQCL